MTEPVHNVVMPLSDLRKATLTFITKVRKQFTKLHWEAGLTDQEFLDTVVSALEIKIKQDIAMERKRWCVAHANLFDNDIKTEFIHAETMQDAIRNHSRLKDPENEEWLKDLPEDIEELKQFFFDADMLVDVLEIRS